MSNTPAAVPAPKTPSASGGPLIEGDDLDIMSAEAQGLPPPREPAESKRTYDEVILPSGRAVRLGTPTTKDYLGAKERAAATAGDLAKNPDPRGARFSAALDRELLALALVAYTERLDWSESIKALIDKGQAEHDAKYAETHARLRPAYVPKVEAEDLLKLLPESSWRRTSPMELLLGEEFALTAVFSDIADWEVLTASVGRLLVPARDLSDIVGKARRVVR